MGAEAVKEMLQELDLDALSAQLKAEIATLIEKEKDRESEGQKRTRAIKRLEVVEAFRQSGNKPEWMMLDVIPVIPPRSAPHGSAGRRPLRHQRPERSVSPRDQP